MTYKNRHSIFCFLFLFAFCLSANAQEKNKTEPFIINFNNEPKDIQNPKRVSDAEMMMAQEYYFNGDFEKATAIYERKYAEDKTQFYYLSKYVDCLKGANQYDKAKNVITEYLQLPRSRTSGYILLGTIYEDNGEIELAEQSYQYALNRLYQKKASPSALAQIFNTYGKVDYAIQAYESNNVNNRFALNIADLYRQTDRVKMMDNILLAIPNYYTSDPYNVIRLLDQFIVIDELPELQKRIYQAIKTDEQPLHNQILIWSFIKQNNFSRAYRQARALDRETSSSGSIVFDLAKSAMDYGNYDIALKSLNYILDNYPNSKYVTIANKEKLGIQYHLFKQRKDVTVEEEKALSQDFRDFASKHPINNYNFQTYRLAADYEGMYRKRIDTAIVLLKNIVKTNRLSSKYKSSAKIDLADYLLISGDRWESTLLYSQVDKTMENAPEGEIARFKNAMLSYYMGDFEWATEQFDVLKRATSKLISNDAIDMSVFISEHLTTDSLNVALRKFAESDLLIFQNKYSEAEEVLDEIAKAFPEDRLIDDIIYRKANMQKDQRKYNAAISLYEELLKNHGESIKYDNALFEMAEVYEKHLDRPQKAGKLYKDLFLNFVTSTLAVEARKRYRNLRKDYPEI